MFGRHNEEKQAQKAAAQAEVDRLRALPPEALAVEVLPVLARLASQQNADAYVGRLRLYHDLLIGFPGAAATHLKIIEVVVHDALQRLEHANLVVRENRRDGGADGWRLTDLGRQALAAGDADQRLGNLARTTG